MELRKKDILLKGIGVSPGIIIGKVFLLDPSEIEVSTISLNTKEEIDQEINLFKAALKESRQQLLNVKKEVEHKKYKEASYIIDAQILILEDKLLIENITKTIKKKKIDAASAAKDTISGLSKSFDDVGDEYLKERKTDIDYIGERIIRNILGRKQQDISTIKEESIIVARDLSPADTATWMSVW